MRKFLNQLAAAGAKNANIVPAPEIAMAEDFTLAEPKDVDLSKLKDKFEEQGTGSFVISTKTAPTFYEAE